MCAQLAAKLVVLCAVVGGLVACKSAIDAEGFEVDPEFGGTSGLVPDAAACGTQVEPPSELVRSCTLMLSCAVTPPWTISACITSDLQHAYHDDPCTYGASNCEQVWSCLGEGRVGTLCDDDKNNRCDGQRLVACAPSNGEGFWRDCQTLGGKCAVSDSLAGCLVVDSCDKNDTTQPHCSGSRLYVCNGGGWGTGRDCANFDSICAEGVAACRFEGDGPCSVPTDQCDGDTHVVCANDRIYRYDCASAGLTCLHDGVSAECVAPACVPDDLDRCEEFCGDEGVMNVCVGGAPYQIRCSDFQLGGCRERQLGSVVSVYCET